MSSSPRPPGAVPARHSDPVPLPGDVPAPEDVGALPAAERILAAAAVLFYRDGIRATGVDRVIAESGVAKLTFYRHYPSKALLVMAFLQQRHQQWMAWFRDALQRHGAAHRGIAALEPALREWLASPRFRGCAFINVVAELGDSQPEALALSRQHKAEMSAEIAAWLPVGRHRQAHGQALAQAVDGAIFHAQLGPGPQAVDQALQGLRWAVAAMRGLPDEAADGG